MSIRSSYQPTAMTGLEEVGGDIEAKMSRDCAKCGSVTSFNSVESSSERSSNSDAATDIFTIIILFVEFERRR